MDAGSVTNTATASGTNPSTRHRDLQLVLGDGRRLRGHLVAEPVKSTTSTGYAAAGDIIDYSYMVTNTGTTTISDVAVSDNLIPVVSCPSSTLAPGPRRPAPAATP